MGVEGKDKAKVLEAGAAIVTAAGVFVLWRERPRRGVRSVAAAAATVEVI